MNDRSEFLRQLFQPDPEDQPATLSQPVTQPATVPTTTARFLDQLFND